MRRTQLLAGTIGVLAIASAATLRFVVVPGQAQLPADTDTSRAYEGTIGVMLNAEALAAVDLANVMVRDLPISIERTTTVTDVADGNATVTESAVVSAPDGSPVLATDATYLVDRRTMEAQGDRAGLVIGWPIGTEQRDYTGWSSDLQSEVDLAYLRTEAFQGIDAYVFEADYTGRIVDPEVLARFPASLPKSALPIVAQVLAVEPEIAAGLTGLMDALPDDVPLGYWLSSATTYWVDPTTGMVLDIDRTESRDVAFDVDGVPAMPLASVFSMSYRGTEASVADTVADAESSGAQLIRFGTTFPIALVLLGAVLILVAATRRGAQEEIIDLFEATKDPVRV